MDLYQAMINPIELHDLLLEPEQLSAERGETGARNLRHPLVTCVGNNLRAVP